MSVYYKFKSARDFDSILIDGHFISVASLKERIFESKHLGRGTDFDLMVSNAQSNEEYVDENTLIPKNSSVLIRRVPGRPRKPIVTQQEEPKPIEDKIDEMSQKSNIMPFGDSSATPLPDDSDWDEFGNDLYSIPEVLPAQPSNPVVNVLPPSSNIDEENNFKALIDTPSLDWQRQGFENYGSGRSFGRGMGGRGMIGGRGFGRGGGLERKTPPQGYICHRCKVPGHLIQHCPTNGDPSYDVRRVKPPTGIPKSMLMTTPDGSYALPSGAVAVLKPNEAAFEKEIEGMPSTRPVTDFPPELHCPLCKEVMKDAVLTSKCCFSSYCDKCIRDHIISKSMCVCGFTNIFADDLLPNKTLRETIRRIMESSTTSSAENAGSFVHVQDMESARPLPPKDSSPSLSATKDETAREVPKLAPLAPHSMMEVDVIADNKGKEAVVIAMTPDDNVNHVDPKPTPESVNIKMATSQESMPIPKENLEKMLLAEQGKKKKKKKIRPPVSSEMLWRGYQDSGLETFGPNGMPMQPSAYNPYMSNMSNMNNMAGMPWVMDGGYMAHFPAGPMPSIPYHHGPYDVPYGGMMPPDPFASQGFMMPPSMPIPPHRDLVGFNKNSVPPPMIGREDVGVRNADIRKRETHRNNESYHDRFRDREYSRDNGSNAEKPSLKPKPKISLPLQTVMDQPSGRGKSPVRSSYDRDGRDRRNSPAPLPISNSRTRSKPKPVDVDESSTGGGERKYKPSVFSRISFPDPDKKSGGGKQQKSDSEPQKETGSHRRSERERRISSSSGGGAGGGEHFRRKSSYDHDSSEEEYHFKRRPSSSSTSSRYDGGMAGERGNGNKRSSRQSRERENDRLAKRR